MKRYRICSACGKTWNTSSKLKGEKKYICPHCEYKKSRPGTAIPKAAKKKSKIS
jgi:DNA-directed RNA polymerase subunit RPC12/RpoP